MSILCIVLLLPTLASGSIKVNLHIRANYSESFIEIFGSSTDVVSDKERESFQIEDDNLKDASDMYSGRLPDDVYVKSPTPWDDLYIMEGWQEVGRTLYPMSAEIIAISSHEYTIHQHEFVNNSSGNASFNALLSQEVEEYISNNWLLDKVLTVSEKLHYIFTFAIGDIGGTGTLSYWSAFGETYVKKIAVLVGSTAGVAVDLEPGQSATAELKATRNNMVVKLDFTASLHGDIACNYARAFNGHHFWRYEINAVMATACISRSTEAYETLEVGYFSNAYVVVNDKRSGKQLLEKEIPTVMKRHF